ncbi:hypothetical protein M0Q97_05295 [Candidatus Dojkabacteria bacterium]|jgi:hypothetical protein|nr:hypothetical protein [Candidatus Dojkabacteria bacterium]
MIKKFESWKNNIIDQTLFTSGKAKYDPDVSAGKIKYQTGKSEPYYFAEIISKGNKFICKIYKRRKGEDVRIKNKVKDNLKDAHNYVREFLNQRLKKDKKRTSKDISKDNIDRTIPSSSPFDLNPFHSYEPPLKPKRKPIVRHY